MVDAVGLALILMVVALLIVAAATSRFSPQLRMMLCAALGLRVAGAIAYYGVTTSVYGSSDARAYVRHGAEYSSQLWQGDFSMFSSFSGRLWGTNFIELLTGLTTALVGNSVIANNVLFSLAAFAGLWGFASAFQRNYPGVPLTNYVRWIWLFPSLWFWTSAAGKEAILFLGLGLAVNGFAGVRHKIRWVPLLAGSACIFVVRPQVMAVVVFSMMLAQWLSESRRWTARNVFQGFVFLAGSLLLIRIAFQSIGIEAAEDVSAYVETRALHTAEGNTSVTNVGPGLAGAPFAAFNVLFRPLPWDVSGGTAALSMLEIYIFWFLAFRRHKAIWQVLKNWRRDRLVAMAVIFTVLYCTILGMVVVNLGIIARQRASVFPFLFLLFEAIPARDGLRSFSSSGSRPERPPRNLAGLPAAL